MADFDLGRIYEDALTNVTRAKELVQSLREELREAKTKLALLEAEAREVELFFRGSGHVAKRLVTYGPKGVYNRAGTADEAAVLATNDLPNGAEVISVEQIRINRYGHPLRWAGEAWIYYLLPE